MKLLLAFINGMREYRLTYTTHYENYYHMCAYDYGREWAHRLTFRRYET